MALRQHLPETSFRVELCSKVTTGLTRDNLGSGHPRSFWNSDLRNLSVIPHFEGSDDWGLTRASHGHFAQVAALAVWLTRALRSRPTGESILPAPDQFREREVFTSNTVGYSSNLLCSTHCMLTRAMFTSNMSWDFIQLQLQRLLHAHLSN